MILKDKIAIVHGAGGDIGGAVARAFAREGAKLFLSGRNLRPVEALATDIEKNGGYAEAAEVDALDEQSVEKYVNAVREKAHGIDISFNAISIAREMTRKVPLLELSEAEFSRPIATYTRANFLTARSAARHMVAKRSGVILTITGTPGRAGFSNVGGTGPAYAALVALTRALSAELGPQGVRALCLMPNAVPETATIRENFERYARALNISGAQFQAQIASMTHLKRLTTLAEVANTAAFLVSDQASGLTGTVVNLSGGGVVD